MNSKDGFFISKETFSGLSTEAQNEILAALGLDVLQDNDDLMILSKADVQEVLKYCQAQVDLNERNLGFYSQLIKLVKLLGKRRKHVTNLEALSKISKIPLEKLVPYFNELNRITKELCGRKFAELSEQNTVVYVAKDTLKAIRLSIRQLFLRKLIIRKK